MLRYIIAILFLLLPVASEAAITYSATTESANTPSASTMTTSVVVGAGTDRVLVAACQEQRSAGVLPGAITGITYNSSESFTFLKRNTINNTFAAAAELWILVNPTVTTANAVVTFTNALSDRVQACSFIQLNGVTQSTTPDAVSGSSGTSTAIETIITTVAADAWIIDSTIADGNTGVTVGAGQSARTDRIVGSSLSGVGASTVNGKASPGAETMDWTTATGSWVIASASFSPSGGSDPPTGTITQATLRWTNGTDGTGVTLAGIRRCTGASCTPTTLLTTVSATNSSAGTFVDTTLDANTTYNWCVYNADAAGNLSTCTAFGTGATTGTTFRTTLATDTFDRTNNADLGATWDAGYTARNAGAILSNQVKASTSPAMETYNGVSTPNDQWAQFTASTWTIANGNVFLRLRNSNSPTDTGYECGVITNGTTAVLREINAGVTTTVIDSQTLASTGAAGDKFRCEVEGTALKFYQIRGTAETLIASGTNAVHTSGKTGFRLTDSAIPTVLLNDFAMGGFSVTAPVEPTIDLLTLDATGANLTYGATTPTAIRVQEFTNTATIASIVHPIADFVAGRFTQTWRDGLSGVCFYPINSVGTENSASTSYRCASLAGIVDVADTAVAVLSNPVPSGSLPFGTTSTTISVTLDKPATCIANLTDVAYASMDTALVMSLNGLVASITVGSLTNGSTTHRYIRCNFVNSLDDSYPNLTSTDITIAVLAGAGADTTAPSTVAGLLGTAVGQVVTLTWTAATDNAAVAGYQVYQSTDACVTPMVAGNPVAATSTQLNLAASTAYCFTVKAIDTSNNLSASHSNQATVTTGPTIDVIPPSDMTGLAVDCNYTASCVLSWTTGTDDHGGVTSTVESCLVVAPSTDCSNFAVYKSQIAVSILRADLTPSSSYCFRGRHSDGSGNAGGYSDTECGTTLASGLNTPRTDVPFGINRGAATRSASSARSARP